MKHPDVGPCQIYTVPIPWIRSVFLLLFIALSTGLSAQEKGTGGLVPETQRRGGGTTRAVVVGISDYQHPDIPDLRFAHRDAIAFSEYINKSKGDQDTLGRIETYINENATATSIYNALYAIETESEPGDKIIFYFSGHGDMERASKSIAYLLCTDASYNNYSLGGTISFEHLKSWAARLNKNKINVQLFLDACHAGNLAGNAIQGPGMAVQVILDSIPINTKFLACTSSEFSFESPAWGGGHGAFTYHLIHGLNGLSDIDKNGLISNWELKKYIEEQVVNSTNYLQHPIGPNDDLEETIAIVDSSILSRAIQSKNKEFLEILSLKYKSYSNKIELSLPQELKIQWDLFIHAIDNNNLLDPSDSCANKYYTSITSHSNLSGKFRRYIEQIYLSSLLNQGQYALKQILHADTKTISGGYERAKEYENFHLFFHRAAQILGSHHDLYHITLSRANLLEGIVKYYNTVSSSDTSTTNAILTCLNNAITYDPESALSYYYSSLVHFVKKQSPDTAIELAKIAHDLSPTWVIPLTHVAYYLASPPYKRFEDSKQLLELAMTSNSNDATIWMSLGALYHYIPKRKEAIDAFKKAISIDSSFALAWSNLGSEYALLKNYQAAQSALDHALRLNPNQSAAWHIKGCIYSNQYQQDSAEICYLLATQLNSVRISTLDSLASIYIKRGNAPSCIEYSERILSLNENYPNAHYLLALSYIIVNNKNKSMFHINRLIEIDPTYKKSITSNEQLRTLYHE